MCSLTYLLLVQLYKCTICARVQVHYLNFSIISIILKLYRSTNRAVLQIYVCIALQVPYLCCATGGLFVQFKNKLFWQYYKVTTFEVLYIYCLCSLSVALFAQFYHFKWHYLCSFIVLRGLYLCSFIVLRLLYLCSVTAALSVQS